MWNISFKKRVKRDLFLFRFSKSVSDFVLRVIFRLLRLENANNLIEVFGKKFRKNNYVRFDIIKTQL